ncbi:DUF1214 domain-containing protein [Robertkochia marina]|uniref:DUF1214 domain-containing protein n=2 Tax=Robertkochia marina TaxID=1227945 RepID=A0A4S3LXH3_9FLAO|nr:DUF1214 domain-containing protein [Robertkochia marina]TRZ47040.1 DUF1214 domain-containing protein [Robertkochia marina]
MACNTTEKKKADESTQEQTETAVDQEKSSAITVTQENFPTAYSNMRMGVVVQNAGGVNAFMEMPTPPSNPEEQPVVRMNRDTYYSAAVIDVSEDAYITIPETDEYVSIQIVDENHETQPMIYGPGRHKITAKTDHVFIIVRALEDEVRKNLQVEAASSKPFEMKEWDMESFKKLEAEGNAVFVKGYDQSKAFGSKETGQTTYMNFIGAAGGWGGAMVVDNIYQTSEYLDTDGCYEMTFPDPENTYFWSATVYNANGYLFNDVANISSEMDPEINEDGSITVRFGCDDMPNNIPIREGNTTGKFNVVMRHYGPSDNVRNGAEGYNATELIKKVD